VYNPGFSPNENYALILLTGRIDVARLLRRRLRIPVLGLLAVGLLAIGRMLLRRVAIVGALGRVRRNRARCDLVVGRGRGGGQLAVDLVLLRRRVLRRARHGLRGLHRRVAVWHRRRAVGVLLLLLLLLLMLELRGRARRLRRRRRRVVALLVAGGALDAVRLLSLLLRLLGGRALLGHAAPAQKKSEENNTNNGADDNDGNGPAGKAVLAGAGIVLAGHDGARRRGATVAGRADGVVDVDAALSKARVGEQRRARRQRRVVRAGDGVNKARRGRVRGADVGRRGPVAVGCHNKDARVGVVDLRAVAMHVEPGLDVALVALAPGWVVLGADEAEGAGAAR